MYRQFQVACTHCLNYQINFDLWVNLLIYYVLNKQARIYFFCVGGSSWFVYTLYCLDKRNGVCLRCWVFVQIYGAYLCTYLRQIICIIPRTIVPRTDIQSICTNNVIWFLWLWVYQPKPRIGVNYKLIFLTNIITVKSLTVRFTHVN